MADPLSASPALLLDPHHHPPRPPPPAAPRLASAATHLREYRKGNWTRHETLVLITAKKLDDERRTRAAPSSSSSASCKTAELRWKWVENYCWANGCLRSQNQCNDKWDNLLRDYKKVREYQAQSAAAGGDRPSYWKMEKHERKERNLPTNLAPEIFEALQEVVNRRQTPQKAPPPVATPNPPVCSPPPPPPEPPITAADVTDSSETEGGSEPPAPDSAAKRRKARSVGPSIVRSAAAVARALLACEERKEKRHRDALELEERRLRMEESRVAANRQGVEGLISAVDNLSGAIQALVAGRKEGR